MSLPFIIGCVYFALGVGYAFFAVTEDKKKGKVDPTAAMTDPATFWLFIAFWPIATCIRALNTDEDGKK